MRRVLDILLCFLNVLLTFSNRIHGPSEYCQSDVFRATCRRNEVVVMTSATYGRMHIGKCVVANLGYLGCSSDVLPLLHTACSGKPECEYPVPSTELDQTKPCFQELKTFLEVSYMCVKVAMAEKAVCSASGHLKLLSGHGHLSSHVAAEYACGTLSSPWRIIVSPGQTLHLFLIQFSCQTKDEPLGYITDMKTGQNQTLVSTNCSAEQTLMTSHHSVDVQILVERPDPRPFLIRYEVSGCQDLVAPRFAWYRRDGDHAVVGCVHSKTTWHLTCDVSTWIGVIGNCLPEAAAVGGEPQTKTLPTASTIVIILCIALAIALAVLGCGFWTVFRNHLQKKAPDASSPSLARKTPVLASCPDSKYCQQQQKYSTAVPPELAVHTWGGAGDGGRVDIPGGGRGDPGGTQGGLSWDGDMTPGDSDYGSQSYSSMRHVGTAPYGTQSSTHAPYSTHSTAPSYIVATQQQQQQSHVGASVPQNSSDRAGERCVLIGPVH